MTGKHGKRTKTYFSFENNLQVGGLYCHLGPGFQGFQRVLSVIEEELASHCGQEGGKP